MGFFERPDPRLMESADPSPGGAVARVLLRHAIALPLCAVIVVAAYAATVAIALHESATMAGTIYTSSLHRPVIIVRDLRDIPHIRASDDHDLYFAEGFVEGSDRLFQLDLTRRYAYGRLAEVLGPKALSYDEAQRAVDIGGIAERQFQALAPNDRAAIVAFSDGVNAAAAMQPPALEFRMLLYDPQPWTPKDSLAVSIVASLELSDSWRTVVARDAIWRERGTRCFDLTLPLSDGPYDVTSAGAFDRTKRRPSAACTIAALPNHQRIGSNAWASGGALTADGHALLANDPHLDLTVPGIWYLVDLQSPQTHAAGATIPGIPGIVLGHNERVAWASTNADVTTTSVFTTKRPRGGSWVGERFKVRFSHDVVVRYYRTRHEFSVPADDPETVELVRWPIYAQTRSTIATGLALERAADLNGALAILARYRGSPQNFLVADRTGAVAYHMAGLVPNDPAWGRYVHQAADLRQAFAPIAFGALPKRRPARNALLVSANNKPYGENFPYRLSAQFEPPYRAYRIATLLHARSRYDWRFFARMQMDTLSPIDLEVARDIVRLNRTQPLDDAARRTLHLLRGWDGRFTPQSRAAAVEHAIRESVFGDVQALGSQLAGLGGSGAPELRQDAVAALPYSDTPPWGYAGRVRIEYLLAPLHFSFLDGYWLPGAGDEYTIHLQEPGMAQGFRAVWDVGDWDRGGIAIPSGESGEQGSGHYTDLTRDWTRGVLWPLPFTAAAVARDAANVLVLQPRGAQRTFWWKCKTLKKSCGSPHLPQSHSRWHSIVENSGSAAGTTTKSTASNPRTGPSVTSSTRRGAHTALRRTAGA
jgi:penicillin G amidase